MGIRFPKLNAEATPTFSSITAKQTPSHAHKVEHGCLGDFAFESILTRALTCPIFTNSPNSLLTGLEYLFVESSHPQEDGQCNAPTKVLSGWGCPGLLKNFVRFQALFYEPVSKGC